MISARRVLHVVAYDVTVFERSAVTTLAVTALSPALFLGAIGVGLGGLVQRGAGGVDGVAYLDFLAPGLLVTGAMQLAAEQLTYPVLDRLVWGRVYEAITATPVGSADIVVAALTWLAMRLLLLGCLFVTVAAIFGTMRTAAAPLAVAVAAATGLAFGAPILAFTATLRRDAAIAALTRFVITPLFLLGGAFFPVATLPAPARAIAWATPLSHGVSLARDLSLGRAAATESAAHLAVLAAYIGTGTALALVTFRRRLVR